METSLAVVKDENPQKPKGMSIPVYAKCIYIHIHMLLQKPSNVYAFSRS
jgi:hypothetical protein